MARTGRILVLLVLMGASGCDDRVCFQWSEEEGECPPPEDADRFIAPDCGEKVLFDLEEQGEFDEDVCCYDVSKEDDDFCE